MHFLPVRSVPNIDAELGKVVFLLKEAGMWGPEGHALIILQPT